MATATAILNEMASNARSEPPRGSQKRQRKSTVTGSSPSKRTATAKKVVSSIVEEEGLAHRVTTPQPLVREIRPERDSLPSSSAARRTLPRSKAMYELPQSPEGAQQADAMPAADPSITKKKLMRKLGQKKTLNAISPLKGLGFDGVGEMNSKALLSSYDSPAKNTRKRYIKPLDKLKSKHLENSEFVMLNSRGRPKRVSQNKKGFEDSEVGFGTDMGGNSSANNVADTAGPEREDPPPSSGDSLVEETDGQAEQQAPSPYEQPQNGASQRLPRQDAPEEAYDEGDSVQDAITAMQPTQPRKITTQRNTARSPRQDGVAGNTRRISEGGSVSDTQEDGREPTDQAPGPSQRRGRRPAMSQEERQTRREAEARKRQEDYLESQRAEEATWEDRCQKFVRGIEHAAEQIGGVESWSKMGGGAKTITAMGASKNDMDTTRANSVWRPIRNLASWFKGIEEAEEVEIAETLAKLQRRATWNHLSKGGNVSAGDKTVMNIFEHLVPHSVFLLKHALNGRFSPESKHAWQEMQSLTDIAFNLCEVAQCWTPKPSTLETGIRSEVRQHIKPALNDIRAAIKVNLSLFKEKESRRKGAQDLALSQKQAKARREERWAALQASMESCHLQASQEQRQPHSQRQDVVDIDELDDGDDDNDDDDDDRDDDNDDNDKQYQEGYNQPVHARPGIIRRATEEIPAPDPIVVWAEGEEVALLNGLQQFTGADRYNRILETYAELMRKDVDQCMARAQYYKQACREMLVEKEAKGDHSSDWLRSV